MSSEFGPRRRSTASPAKVASTSSQQQQPQQSTTDNDMSAIPPFPVKKMAVLAVVLLNESLCSSMLMPFIGLYVAHLQGTRPEEAGYASGLLIGVFMLGQVCSGKKWGSFSDHYGRKPALLGGLLLSAVIMLLFGLAPNLYFCIIVRLFHGLTNGNIVVAKAMIPELATHKAHEAKGFSLISLTWGFGCLMGPGIGGFLYDPARYSWLGLSPHGFMAQYPAFLPSLVISLYSFTAFVLSFQFLRETNIDAKPLRIRLRVPRRFRSSNRNNSNNREEIIGKRSLTEEDVVALNAAAAQYATTTTERHKHTCDHWDVDKGSDTDAPDQLGETLPPISQRQEQHQLADTTSTPPATVTVTGTESTVTTVARRKLGYKEVFLLEQTRLAVLLYMIIAFTDIIFNEVQPLWAVAARTHGGLGVNSEVVGVLVICTSFPCIMANVTFSYALDFFRGPRNLWVTAVWLLVIPMLLTPLGTWFTVEKVSVAYLILLGLPRQLGTSWCFSTVFLLLGRTAPAGCLGALNGAAQSMAALIRTMAPILISPLFAWSISAPHPFPFNHHLTFILGALPLLVAIPLCTRLCALPCMVASSNNNKNAITSDKDKSGERCIVMESINDNISKQKVHVTGMLLEADESDTDDDNNIVNNCCSTSSERAYDSEEELIVVSTSNNGSMASAPHDTSGLRSRLVSPSLHYSNTTTTTTNVNNDKYNIKNNTSNSNGSFPSLSAAAIGAATHLATSVRSLITPHSTPNMLATTSNNTLLQPTQQRAVGLPPPSPLQYCSTPHTPPVAASNRSIATSLNNNNSTSVGSVCSSQGAVVEPPAASVPRNTDSSHCTPQLLPAPAAAILRSPRHTHNINNNTQSYTRRHRHLTALMTPGVSPMVVAVEEIVHTSSTPQQRPHENLMSVSPQQSPVSVGNIGSIPDQLEI